MQHFSKENPKYWRTTHKIDIKVPKTVEEVLEVYIKTGTAFWTEGMKKDINNVTITLKILMV